MPFNFFFTLRTFSHEKNPSSWKNHSLMIISCNITFAKYQLCINHTIPLTNNDLTPYFHKTEIISKGQGVFVNVHMNRQEAMDMLKELIACHLVNPVQINIMLRKPEHYQVQIKGDYNCEEIEEHARKHDLVIEEDKERNCLVIYKP